MYYGNESAENQEDITSVWAGYEGVWHLDEDLEGDGGSELYKDSTANANYIKDYIQNTGKDGKIGLGQQYEADTTDFGLVSNLNAYLATQPTTPIAISGLIRHQLTQWLRLVVIIIGTILQ